MELEENGDLKTLTRAEQGPSKRGKNCQKFKESYSFSHPKVKLNR